MIYLPPVPNIDINQSCASKTSYVHQLAPPPPVPPLDGLGADVGVGVGVGVETIPKHNPIKRVYVELIRELIESEEKNESKENP